MDEAVNIQDADFSCEPDSGDRYIAARKSTLDKELAVLAALTSALAGLRDEMSDGCDVGKKLRKALFRVERYAVHQTYLVERLRAEG